MSPTGRCAIVGGGLAGFIAYVTLRHGGLTPDEITVFADEADPAAAWRRRAGAIRQRRMRSESDGHCLPRSFPGLAVQAARRRQDILPLIQTVCNRYSPTVEEFLEHVAELRARCDWDESVRPARIESVLAVDGGFRLDGNGSFRHVLLAPGHPGLALPEELAGDPRVVHAYEPHAYADEVAVVGAGMAAATEWVNALEVGAHVVSVRRREPERRPLNVPRSLFSKRGLTGFHATDRKERTAELRRLLVPSYPAGAVWDDPIERAAHDGRFRVASTWNGEPQIVCATGFRRGFQHTPLLSRLVEQHTLDTDDQWIVVSDDCAVPALTNETRTLGLAGVPAQWAYPAADTLVGMKYAARGFMRRVTRCRTH